MRLILASAIAQLVRNANARLRGDEPQLRRRLGRLVAVGRADASKAASRISPSSIECGPKPLYDQSVYGSVRVGIHPDADG